MAPPARGTANSSRIATERPTIAPNRSRVLGGKVRASAAISRIVTPPISIVAPPGTMTSVTREPCHQVPLVEPRSLTRTPPATAVSSVWRRDTLASSRTKSQVAWAPTTTGRAPSAA
jgi:hypothetical protein